MLKRFFNIIVILIMSQVVFAGGSISGKIVDSVGQPIAGIGVQARRDFAYVETSANTDPNGYYQLNNLSLTEYSVVAIPSSSTDYARNVVHNINVTQEIDYPIADIVLDNGALSVSGIVTDKNTSAPLNNIWMLCFFKGTWISEHTDASGEYLFTNLPPGTTEISVPSPAGYASTEVEIELAGDVTNLNFELFVGVSLSGVVVDIQTAQPIPNIELEFWNEQYNSWTNATTDSDGHFTLTHLPPGIAEIIAMPQVDTGYAWSLNWPATWINIPEAEDVQNRVIALQKGALVTGYIKHPDGLPFALTEFDFRSQLAEGWNDTDPNGYFEIRLPLGDNGLSIELDDGYSQQSLTPNITDLSTPIDLGDIIIYSQTDGSQITGLVSNPTVAPYQGVFEVSVFPAGTTMTADNFGGFCDTSWVELADFGSYSLKSLPPGNYDLYLWLINEDPQGPETIAIRDIIYNVSTGASNIDLAYDSQGGTLTGAIINQYSDPILGAVAFLADSTTGKFAGLADADPNGQFTIYNFEPGTYTLTATHPMYMNEEIPVTITLGATTTVPTITMDFAGIKQGSDLNGDGHTNIADIEIFTSKWLTTDSDANFDQQGLVQFSDFAALAQLWMSQATWYNEITQ